MVANSNSTNNGKGIGFLIECHRNSTTIIGEVLNRALKFDL